jgi:spore germination protein
MNEPPLDETVRKIESLFADSGDFVGRRFRSGGADGPAFYLAYIDLLVDRDLIELSILDRMTSVNFLSDGKTPAGLLHKLQNGGLPTADIRETSDYDEAVTQLLTGDAVIFIDGCPQMIILSVKGYPNRGVPGADTEVVVQGPKEAFSESFRINTTLMRRRIRDTRLKVKQMRVGRRSRTDVALIYLDGIARPHIVETLEAQLKNIDIDAIPDSGFLAQLLDRPERRPNACPDSTQRKFVPGTPPDNPRHKPPYGTPPETLWRSPFPKTQLTERPDKAAASLLEGRIAVIVDGSPFVMLAPATLNVFFQSAEDYYHPWFIMTLFRSLRWIAAFLAVTLPGFYMAAAVYHPAMIPLLLTIKIAASRRPVPFPAVVEIIIMDIAFELLREAGTRLPGAAGGTVGIVGGLIIGQAAVEAGLVSPIVVIVIALTGIATFAVPSLALTNGLRLVKYLILILSAVLGLLGFWAGLLLTVTHLAALRSYGIPYLMPYSAGELNQDNDWEDSFMRFPLSKFIKRPFFAKQREAKRQS